jgi:hypothetical protein
VSDEIGFDGEPDMIGLLHLDANVSSPIPLEA